MDTLLSGVYWARGEWHGEKHQLAERGLGRPHVHIAPNTPNKGAWRRAAIGYGTLINSDRPLLFTLFTVRCWTTLNFTYARIGYLCFSTQVCHPWCGESPRFYRICAKIWFLKASQHGRHLVISCHHPRESWTNCVRGFVVIEEDALTEPASVDEVSFYESDVYEINHMNCGNEIKWRLILAVMNAIICICVKKPEKKFFRLLYANAYNCVHNCEDQPSSGIILSRLFAYWISIFMWSLFMDSTFM